MNEQNSDNFEISDFFFQNIEKLRNVLSQSLLKQEKFLNIFKNSLIKLNDKEQGKTIHITKLCSLLSELINELGITFCELINDDKELVNILFLLFLDNKDSVEIQNIFININNIYNYDSCQSKFGQIIKERIYPFLGDKLNTNIRKAKTEIENFNDEILLLYYNIINNKQNFIRTDLENSLKEKEFNLKWLKTINRFPGASLEYFNKAIEKIKTDLEHINNKSNINPNHENKINGKININNENPINNIKLGENNDSNISSDEEIILNTELLNEERKMLQKIELKNRTFFYHKEYVNQGEDQYTEFKNYSYPLEDHGRRELRRQYIGFLNSKGGRIYIGINDEKQINGVTLTYKNSDIFRNELVGFSNDFYPQTRIEKINVYFIPIKNPKTGKFKKNLYVVKIVILPGEKNYLYCTNAKGGGMVSSIRRQTQVFSLSIPEIHQQIIERSKYTKDDDVNDDCIKMDDPEPENVFEVESDSEEFDNKSNGNSDGVKLKKRCEFILRINNIDRNLKPKDINKIFTYYGAHRQNFKGNNGKNSGEGFLVFATEEKARVVMDKFNGTDLGGNTKVTMKLEKVEYFYDENKNSKL